LILSRQNLPTLDRTKYAPATGVAQGAYILADTDGGLPQIILIATGSEVLLCIAAYEQLAAEGFRARVVSMPSWELFEQQDRAYRDSVLPPAVTARISVEMAATLGWAKFVGPHGVSIGMETFGASAPLKALEQKFGFTVEHVLQQVKEMLS
jgi:transketolase